MAVTRFAPAGPMRPRACAVFVRPVRVPPRRTPPAAQDVPRRSPMTTAAGIRTPPNLPPRPPTSVHQCRANCEDHPGRSLRWNRCGLPNWCVPGRSISGTRHEVTIATRSRGTRALPIIDAYPCRLSGNREAVFSYLPLGKDCPPLVYQTDRKRREANGNPAGAERRRNMRLCARALSRARKRLPDPPPL